MSDWEQKKLMEEIARGRQLAEQLQCHVSSPSSSSETRDLLLQQILDSYDKALSILNQSKPGVSGVRMPDSPHSLSEESEKEQENSNRDVYKKRKSMQKWTEHVRVNPGTGLEGALDDGFSWRKYGQKDILGAKYPRGYYRCTHRHAQGCLATKQVQRSDSDPTIVEITYHGCHSCTQASRPTPPSNLHENLEPAGTPMHSCTQASRATPPSSLPENQEPRTPVKPQQQSAQTRQQNEQGSQQDLLLSFQTGLRVVTENMETQQVSSIPPLFQFYSSSYTSGENQTFSPSIMEGNKVAGNVLSSFTSPATSEADYFSISPTAIHGFGGNENANSSSQSLHAFDTELSGILSAVTSGSNSPTLGIEFPFDPSFTSGFTFDNSGFFS